MKKSHIARFDQSMSRPLASRSRSLRSFGETFGQKQKRIGDKHESCPKNVKYKRKERNFKRMKENESQTPPLCISFQICVYLPKSKDPGIHVNIGHPRKLCDPEYTFFEKATVTESSSKSQTRPLPDSLSPSSIEAKDLNGHENQFYGRPSHSHRSWSRKHCCCEIYDHISSAKLFGFFLLQF